MHTRIRTARIGVGQVIDADGDLDIGALLAVVRQGAAEIDVGQQDARLQRLEEIAARLRASPVEAACRGSLEPPLSAVHQTLPPRKKHTVAHLQEDFSTET